MDKIAIYLRLSKEDDLMKDESNSIANQRELIMDYIRKDKKLRKMEVIELKDDGYSGKNLNRPGVQQLLEIVRKQQVKVIIVKDLSRFQRLFSDRTIHRADFSVYGNSIYCDQ